MTTRSGGLENDSSWPQLLTRTAPVAGAAEGETDRVPPQAAENKSRTSPAKTLILRDGGKALMEVE
ncbi:hypothetical protein GCM10020220_030830 [Nonomuraea rubra]